VLLLASGAAGGPQLEVGDPAAEELGAAVESVCRRLAHDLVADAEGASTVLVVQVEGAPDDDDARRIGLAVAGSPLVKTAVFGADPNAGRLVQAVGDAGVAMDAEALHISVGGLRIVERGVVRDAEDGLAAAMKEPEIVVDVRVGDGRGSATAFGCDLGYEYVRINAEYRT
jgi:glutamate N-acetyltransferase/amino-acid N-acetyltransferase